MSALFLPPAETPQQLQAIVGACFGPGVASTQWNQVKVDATKAIILGGYVDPAELNGQPRPQIIFDPTKIVVGQTTGETIAARLAQATAANEQAIRQAAAIAAQYQNDNRKAWAAIGTVYAIAATAAFGPAGGAIAAAVATAIGNLPPAHPGPGICTTDPPPSPEWSQLKQWAHYRDYYAQCGGYTVGSDPPGTFEAWANPTLAYNQALYDNCYPELCQNPQLLLVSMILLWNSLHGAPYRYVTRRVTSCDFGPLACSVDPIGGSGIPAGAFGTDYYACGSPALYASFSIGTGSSPPAPPPPPPTSTLPPKLVPTSQATSLSRSTSSTSLSRSTSSTSQPSTSKKVLVYTGIVAGVSAAGVGAYAALTGTTFRGALKGLWAATGGRLR